MDTSKVGTSPEAGSTGADVLAPCITRGLHDSCWVPTVRQHETHSRLHSSLTVHFGEHLHFVLRLWTTWRALQCD